MSRVRMIRQSGQTTPEQLNYSADESYLRIVRSLGTQVVDPGDGFGFSQEDGEGIFVPFDEYGGFSAAGTRQVVTCAPGTVFSKQIVVSGTLVLSNAILNCKGNTPAVVVQDAGRLILSNCYITKSDNEQTAIDHNYITVETGGYASVNGCVFTGNQSAIGNLVRNEDAVNTGRVAVVGSANLTDIVVAAQAYFNVGYAQSIP